MDGEDEFGDGEGKFGDNGGVGRCSIKNGENLNCWDFLFPFRRG